MLDDPADIVRRALAPIVAALLIGPALAQDHETVSVSIEGPITYQKDGRQLDASYRTSFMRLVFGMMEDPFGSTFKDLSFNAFERSSPDEMEVLYCGRVRKSGSEEFRPFYMVVGARGPNKDLYRSNLATPSKVPADASTLLGTFCPGLQSP